MSQLNSDHDIYDGLKNCDETRPESEATAIVKQEPAHIHKGKERNSEEEDWSHDEHDYEEARSAKDHGLNDYNSSRNYQAFLTLLRRELLAMKDICGTTYEKVIINGGFAHLGDTYRQTSNATEIAEVGEEIIHAIVELGKDKIKEAQKAEATGSSQSVARPDSQAVVPIAPHAVPVTSQPQAFVSEEEPEHIHQVDFYKNSTSSDQDLRIPFASSAFTGFLLGLDLPGSVPVLMLYVLFNIFMQQKITDQNFRQVLANYTDGNIRNKLRAQEYLDLAAPHALRQQDYLALRTEDEETASAEVRS